MKRTPLYPVYEEYGARVIDFGGWEMPLQFSGIIDEHHAVRHAAGLFDVSHMGQVEISGPGALELVQRLVTNDVAKAATGRALYAMVCNSKGGIIDDLLVFRLGDEDFLLVPNAANTGKVLAHCREVAASYGSGATIADKTADYAVLALQGPQAASILAAVYDGPGDDSPVNLRPFRFAAGVPLAGRQALLVARTGYTGEDGFELFLSPDDAIPLWRELLTAGEQAGLKPAGLGARDTLRFEACLPLYGNELTEDTNPLEAGLAPFVKLDKDIPFIGRDALAAVAQQGPQRKLVGLELLDPGIARHGYPVTSGDGQVIGHVTSGAMAPTLQKSLALAYVPSHRAAAGTEVAVRIRNRDRRARVVDTPFYQRKG